MIDQPAYVKVLLQKYMEGTATKAELAQLMAAWDIYEDEELSDMIAELTGDYKNSDIAAEETVADTNENDLSPKKYLLNDSGLTGIILLTTVILVGCFLIWLFTKQEPKQVPVSCNGIPGNTELPTGPYNCKLLLANNSSLSVNNRYKGRVITDAGVEITQPEAGLLSFELSKKTGHQNTQNKYHTVTTAGGQQYRIILPDGSTVRLNAASSIRFPVEFSDSRRMVYLQGEAFFEVVHNSTTPFYINTGLSQIEIQEATCNINAYSRNIVTTIVKGSAIIKTGAQTARLIAAQKTTARVKTQVTRDVIILSEEDTLAAVSWKKATRIYANISMRQFASDIGRWYNLEIVNINCIPAALGINLSLCYNESLDDVLSVFEKAGLKFYKVGNRITFCDPALRPVSPPEIPLK